MRLALAITIGLFVARSSLAETAPDCSEYDVAKTPAEGVRQVRSGQLFGGDPVKLSLSPNGNCTQPLDICRQSFAAGSPGLELKRHGDWVCVALPGKGKLNVYVGWLALSRWQADKDTSQFATRTWVGVWQNDHARLDVNETNGRVKITANAIWEGPYSPHFGNVYLEGQPVDGVLMGSDSGDPKSTSSDDSCRIAVRRVGKFIFAQDNSNCGATNVRFDGMYRFRAGLKPRG